MIDLTHLKGKTAVITGSTSGIGLGIAKGFADAGLNVVMNGFGDADEIEKNRQDLESRGVKALYNGADMTKPDEIVAMIQEAEGTLGSVDVVVNNAGIQNVQPVEEFPPNKWDAIIAINMNSAFHTVRAAIPGMKQRGWGRIINISSAHGLVASPFKSAYVTAKHGIGGFTKTVALEVAQNGITCNAICPGYVFTPLVEGQIADTAKARGMTEEQVVKDVLLAAQWTKKFVTVEQLAGVALFLCTAAADNITGTSIPVDGGWTAA
ncbi:MAG: 3-hydroxybutyrate dehydrogenase [Candidatus Competibacterales bacterium]